MFRGFMIFVFVLLVSATAQGGNWNSSGSNSTQKRLQTQNPIAALSGFGVNSTALWSGALRTDPSFEADFLAHYKPLETFGVKHIVLVSCADWVINLRCKKPWQNMNGVIQSAKLILDNTSFHVVIQLKAYKQEKVNGKHVSNLNMALEKTMMLQLHLQIVGNQLLRSCRVTLLTASVSIFLMNRSLRNQNLIAPSVTNGFLWQKRRLQESGLFHQTEPKLQKEQGSHFLQGEKT